MVDSGSGYLVVDSGYLVVEGSGFLVVDSKYLEVDSGSGYPVVEGSGKAVDSCPSTMKGKTKSIQSFIMVTGYLMNKSNVTFESKDKRN